MIGRFVVGRLRHGPPLILSLRELF